MCFSIPYKILKIEKKTALIEGGKSVRLGKEIKAEVGDYLQVVGNIPVGKISQTEAIKIRKLIKRLNK